MIEPVALDILLHGRRIGAIARLEGDKSIFTFDESYLEDGTRPTLSLSYKGASGEILNLPRPRQTVVEPFFSNLLPEGTLRDYLARQAGTKKVRDYPLLLQLGQDLPGAVMAVPTDDSLSGEIAEAFAPSQNKPPALRFSLAGVQLKFSALRNKGKEGGLAIPMSGVGGDWIVKLPSPSHPNVPEAEFAAMSLAAKIGMDVPELDLVPIDNLTGLPVGIKVHGDKAYAIRRFDRGPDGPIHIEDFAQVFNVYASDKYENASFWRILAILAIETDEASIVEFVRRLTYSVLIGNGDMHLKNWSLIYPDRRSALLAPTHDMLSTVPYIPNDLLALKLRRSKDWSSFTYEELEKVADKARVPSHLVVKTARETVERFDQAWNEEKTHLPFPSSVAAAIDKHRASLKV
ncbi:type II toxin-antitoxin system HipA family toxin [Novosphingobium sp. JCM 18896]|uniref:type II toxin-antitoxin system HipA family toxin n=1 Tax=Novosphingobium sp. JCM 18896 TaxID=2989731 RepID=UPI00222267FC|nr:HipA domain-containing protein [Novosphingobium sp. JCM 18896]MCW1430255.1 HipA domain-containing protein [Novosphingobium sp. JCM 18896]